MESLIEFPRWNFRFWPRWRNPPEPRDPLNRCLQVRRTQVGVSFDQGRGRMAQQRSNGALVLAVHRQSTRKGMAEVMPGGPFNACIRQRRQPHTVIEVPHIQGCGRILGGKDPLRALPRIEASQNDLGLLVLRGLTAPHPPWSPATSACLVPGLHPSSAGGTVRTGGVR